jgi:hypothetical protein
MDGEEKCYAEQNGANIMFNLGMWHNSALGSPLNRSAYTGGLQEGDGSSVASQALHSISDLLTLSSPCRNAGASPYPLTPVKWRPQICVPGKSKK